jgi:uncharacterized protein (TIGR03086 family)
MNAMTEISDRYRKVAAGFTAQVEAVPEDRWSSPSPCDDWTARDVVGHLVDAHDHFLANVGQSVTISTPVEADPLAAWSDARDAMAAALEDPDVAGAEYDSPLGTQVFEQSADRFVTNDVLVHTWDLATAVGNEVTLDPDEAETAMAVYVKLGDNARNPSVFGDEVPAPADADAQDRLLAYTGRDPQA